MKSEKIEIMKGMKLLNQERIKMHDKKENYKYSAVLKTDSIKQ